MRKYSLLSLWLLVIAGCATHLQTSIDYFENNSGCFLLYNLNTKSFDKTIGDKVCKERFPASSTFKVALAVMAFDAGVLKNEDVIVKWDGKKNTRDEENRDQNAKTWMRDSVVWFSQKLTPQMGEEKLKKYLQDFNYGNEDISAGITKAWLVAPDDKQTALSISAYEQVEFLKKLWTNQLPTSQRSQQITRSITYLETSPKGFVLNGKTGSNYYRDRRRLGWFISHIQKANQQYIAVTNFTDTKPMEQQLPYGGFKAKEITKRILTDYGIW